MAYLGSNPLQFATVNSVATSAVIDSAITDAKLSTTGVVASSYGNAISIPAITIGADGRITTASSVLASISNTGISGNIIGDQITPNLTLSNVYLNGNLTISQAVVENVTVRTDGVSNNVNLDVSLNPVTYYSANSTANVTVDITGLTNAPVGRTSTVTLLMQNGSSPKYVESVKVDGDDTSNIDLKWFMGITPSTGSALALDTYTFTVIKTVDTPEYLVLGSLTLFQ